MLNSCGSSSIRVFRRKLADLCDPGVVLHRPHRVPVLLRVVPHRAEFVDPDRFVFLPHPDLRIDHGAGGIELDEDRDDEKDRQEENQETAATIALTTRRIERRNLDFRNPSLKMKKEGARLSIGILPESFSKNPGHSTTWHPFTRSASISLTGYSPRRSVIATTILSTSMLLDDPIHLRRIAEDFPDGHRGVVFLVRRGVDETDEMKTEAFPLSYFLSDLPGHFPRSDDQDVLF